MTDYEDAHLAEGTDAVLIPAAAAPVAAILPKHPLRASAARTDGADKKPRWLGLRIRQRLGERVSACGTT